MVVIDERGAPAHRVKHPAGRRPRRIKVCDSLDRARRPLALGADTRCFGGTAQQIQQPHRSDHFARAKLDPGPLAAGVKPIEHPVDHALIATVVLPPTEVDQAHTLVERLAAEFVDDVHEPKARASGRARAFGQHPKLS
jgi:hypothetical protein